MNIFKQIQLKRPGHSWFDLSYDHKLSFKMGRLVPVHVQECVPGDHFKQSSEAMFRMMPMIAPIMHKVDIYMHSFFVPNRLLWPNWEKFITGGQNGTAEPPPFPVMNPAASGMNIGASSLGDYMGLPLGNYANQPPTVSALPFAAYQRIWYEFYRDQNLQEGELGNLSDGVQSVDDTNFYLTLQRRAWEHDYFTSALPFAQKGDPVEMPFQFQGTLPVIHTPNGEVPLFTNPDGSIPIAPPGAGTSIWNNFGREMVTTDGTTTTPVSMDPNGTMGVDMDDVTTTTTINDLRTAFSLQKWLEKNARGGSRYIESIFAHFGVRSSDKRLQRPEYIGGSYANMAISEVLQTSQSDATAQGNMAGHGIGVSGGKDYTYHCEEHGYIMTILSVRPKTAYFQGLPRHFSKFDFLDYYWPNFAQLGEQEIKNKEIYMQLPGVIGPTENEGTFGYIPRYSEYRYNPSRVSGAMRTNLDYWHMARKFDELPTLSGQFVVCDPTKRIFAVEDPDEDEIVAHIYHKILAKRMMPKFGNPGGL